jgi:tRNA (guanine37-N1)-methyltransferase
MIDAISRYLPGVLGCQGSAETDSFSDGLLEYPQYTRPADFNGMQVPQVLLSGDHGKIARWRRQQQLLRTWQRRPELLERAELSAEDEDYLARLKQQPEL